MWARADPWARQRRTAALAAGGAERLSGVVAVGAKRAGAQGVVAGGALADTADGTAAAAAGRRRARTIGAEPYVRGPDGRALAASTRSGRAPHPAWAGGRPRSCTARSARPLRSNRWAQRLAFAQRDASCYLHVARPRVHRATPRRAGGPRAQGVGSSGAVRWQQCCAAASWRRRRRWEGTVRRVNACAAGCLLADRLGGEAEGREARPGVGFDSALTGCEQCTGEGGGEG
eukprot:scaffold76753_cov30-Tisochrysis_lutea.AAC.1